MAKSKGSSRSRPQRRRRWLPIFAALVFGGFVAVGVWFLWIDTEIRRDFAALQWALPARLYARPLELYAGAHLAADDLIDYLQLLGYRETARVAGPGEYEATGAVVRLHTRGFEFWDSSDLDLYVEAGFSGARVVYLSGLAGADAPLLVRLEPIEIAQVNPANGEDRLPVSLKEVPQDLVNAVVAVEDQRFYSHYGVDPLGIARALWSNLRAGEVVQGGSTLTQQLVKNLYLNRERTLRRKIEEAMMAVALDYHFDKDRILTAYLNEVFLGQQGNRAIHGFALASQHYFGRPLKELSLAELATLAGLPRGASYYNPSRYPERATERRNVVLARMRELGYISDQQYDNARAEVLQVAESAPSRAGYPAFMELVYSDLVRDYDRDALRTEGLRIFTTLDVLMQGKLEAVLDESVARVERRNDARLEAAVVVTDASSGQVRALAGSRKNGYTGFNRALHAVRPIGSLVKPAVYLAALEGAVFHPASVLSDREIEIRMQDGQLWRPKNYEETTEGDVYLYDALQRSLNLATVDLGMAVGVPRVVDMLSRLGYHKEVAPYPSLLLGAVDMAPIEVAQIYQTLATGGFRSPLRSVEAVSTAQGAPLTWYGIRTEPAADPAALYLLETIMQGVFERGTARSVNPRMGQYLPLAGKTGTTNDTRDSWFAGFGDDLVGVAWLGYDDNSETGLTGATGALRVWADVMSALDIQPRTTPQPPDIVWDEVPQQAVSNPIQRDCSATVMLPFRANLLPDPDWSCGDANFFERLIDRVRN
jgi:penicillin-binding protein 1B